MGGPGGQLAEYALARSWPQRPGSPACCSSSCVATRCAASCSASSGRPCRWAEMPHPSRRPGRCRPVRAAPDGGQRGTVRAAPDGGQRGTARVDTDGGQRGSVTAELALLLPAVVVVLLVCATLGAAAIGQLQCADAARAAARAAAIGEPAAAVAAVARDLAGAHAQVQVDREGEWVEVTVTRPMAGALELSARGTARAWVEPAP